MGSAKKWPSPSVREYYESLPNFKRAIDQRFLIYSYALTWTRSVRRCFSFVPFCFIVYRLRADVVTLSVEYHVDVEFQLTTRDKT